jgi:hypothetical protein
MLVLIMYMLTDAEIRNAVGRCLGDSERSEQLEK